MRIKNKALIKYFGTKNINENSFKSSILPIPQNADVSEIIEILNTFPDKLSAVSITPFIGIDLINNIASRLPASVGIEFSSMTKDCINNLTPEVLSKAVKLFMRADDRNGEAIPISEIASKFPNISELGYPYQVNKGLNCNDFSDITYLIERTSMIDVSPEDLKEYRDFIVANPNYRPRVPVVIGSGTLYNKASMDYWNQNSNENLYYPACELKGLSDLSSYVVEGKTIILYANNMSDVPLSVAEKLKQAGANCKIRMAAHDNNARFQNEDYGLDEYIEMSKVMEELIGDIDENLPEEEKFKQIYERVTKFLAYDYPAAYPKTKEDRKYSDENIKNCRNLRNGLLQGKTVCAGYADILKNACLIKGIECEYVHGPVDSVQSRDYFLYKKKKDRPELVYLDSNSAIVREYHAWNKVKINGVWYNCDPTWDRDEIMEGRGPKYAMLSDEVYRKLGRPTAEVLRHKCTTDMEPSQKTAMFNDLQPAGDLLAQHKVIEFESTVNEYGMPRELPTVPIVMPWTRMMIKLRRFARQQNIAQNIKNTVSKIRSHIDPNYRKRMDADTEQLDTVEDTEKLETIDDTEKLETVEDTEKKRITVQLPIIEDTEPLPVIEDTEPLPVIDETEPLPVIDETEPVFTVNAGTRKNDSAKRPSWELSSEQLSAVRKVERKTSSKNDNENNNKVEEKELGE